MSDFQRRTLVPRFDANQLLPGIMALGVYPLLLALTEDASASFVTAFFLGLWVFLARYAEWAARYWCKRFSVRTASVLAVCAALGPASLIMLADRPDWCLRLFSVFAAVASLALLNDLRDGDHSYLRFRLPNVALRPAYPELARALLIWNIALVLFNEGMIALLEIWGLMVWYAVLPLIIHAVEAAVILSILHRHRQAA
ncbi:hypothetical protein [Pseudotabrizicola sp. L79]|uniref:hypothetical protein n=1 Tax=Pseudotabrizicola sp. L79 TaxID=3118402 RepID=UPI002F955F1B